MKKLFSMIATKEIFFLCIILILSFFLRWKDIEKVPYGIEGDEFKDTTTSLLHQNNLKAADKGIWSYLDNQAKRFPVSIKINQISFAIFGIDYMSPRKALVFTSMFSLFFFYLLARQFLSVNIALIILLLYAVAPYKLISSRIALQQSFGDLFVYPALYFAIACKGKNTLHSYIVVFLAACCTILSIFTYNLSFVLPVIALGIILLRTIKKNVTYKQRLLLIVIFLIPFIFFHKQLASSLSQETTSRSYIMDRKVVNLKDKNIHVEHAIDNTLIIMEELFVGLKYNTSDFLISYPAPLINRVIGLSFMVGFIISIFHFKKYFPLIIWLLLQSTTYHIILGFFLPRMWFLTIGALYILAGIAFEYLFHLLKKTFQVPRIIAALPIIILGIYITLYDYAVFTSYAVQNPAFLKSHREIIEIIKQNREKLGKNIFFVIPEDQEIPTIINSVYAAESFYYIAQNPRNAQIIKTQDRKTQGILTKEEFEENISFYLDPEKTLIIDKTVADELITTVNNHSLCPYSSIQFKYFIQLTKTNCY